ncbi:MAG: hypothetical protein C0448_14520 [Sphingobacteriaceae bacterium]|nr:hypothetical protein [Sphingobacteriaceae bacterium]
MIPRSRNCYDTTLVYLFISGNENMLPPELVDSIPYSTKATWRTYLKEKFVGHAQRMILDEGIRKTELYAKYKRIKKVLTAVESIYTTVSDMLDLVKIPIYRVKKHRKSKMRCFLF